MCSAKGDVAVDLEAGLAHTCVLLQDGGVRCWGANATGQLGLGNTVPIGDNELPGDSPRIDVGGVAVALDTQRNHTCVLLETGAVRCWGEGSVGQLGYGNTNAIGDNETPATAGDVQVLPE